VWQVSQKRAAIQRYLVMSALPNTYTDERGRELSEMILIVQAERSNKTRTVHLRGDWVDTPAHAKAFVHIIGQFDVDGRCIIDNNQNIVVLHPDQLISATVVADSFSCMRRAVLQDRVKATSEASAPLVYGTLLHEVFQEALLVNKWDQTFLNETIDKTMKKHVQDLYTIKVNFTDAREHMASKMPEVRGWAERFISSYPKPEAVAQGRNNEKSNVCVSKLLDIEEHVWSPLYGLKGNIDATIQVTVKDAEAERTLTVPFEVKTGKNVSENHQAQTMLYNLLLTDRYDIEIVYGILYYMETSLTKIIPAVRTELRHMIKQRNQLAVYIRERSVQLPPMKKSKHMCGKCYAQTACFVYHKLADDGDGDSSGVKEKFDEAVKHLTPVHKEFFLKWEDLLTKEEKESQKLRRELWTMLSAEREKVGRCFGNVIIEEGSAHEDLHTQKINRFNYNFVKDDAAPGFSFVDSQLGVGEPIVISDEQGHFALALGFVTSVRKQRISVAVDRRLHNARIKQPGFNEHTNQVYASIMEVVPEGVKPEDSQGKIKEPPIKYRLDKDEFSNGMALVRNNIVSIMGNGQVGSAKIRRLVVDLEPPEFKSVATQYTISDKDSLNTDQKKAIEKVMSAKDYALVLGMPGTGKTTTIAHIIRALIAQKKSVLLTSYTHTAVDNILLKLKKDDIPILRLGAPAKVHPEVQDFAILAGQPMDTFEEIRSAWHDTPVVATTCLGTSHGIFNERTFDYCIVDEASQITLPICLGPIRMARTFVLVGDHNQLPPLVQNEEARLGGLDVSLFKLLSDTHPASVVNLEHQYRMSEDIMTLSNTLIYESRLKCGTEELRFRNLDIPNIDALQKHHFDINTILSQPTATPNTFCAGVGPCWLRDMIDPTTRVSFINTDRLPASREESKGSRIVNPCEARIVTQLVDALLTVGVPAAEIGVMTHYRSQLSLLKHGLRGHGGGAIEMHTADRFQGRDKEVVILSLVRSNEACHIGDLLKDWRRINVAFTRAKTKLLVVGSKSTLKGSGCEEMLARFIGLMEERNWIYELPHDALDGHVFEDAATQFTATGRRGSAGERLSSPVKGMKTPKKRAFGGVAGKENALPPPGSMKRFLESGGGKENGKSSAKRARANPGVLLKGKPNIAGILNDMMGGVFQGRTEREA
jgi:DNA replication ATP-dependent helicase Dna2